MGGNVKGEGDIRFALLAIVIVTLAGAGSAAQTSHSRSVDVFTIDSAWAAEKRQERQGAACRDARQGLIYYRLRWQSWHALRGYEVRFPSLDLPRACGYTRYLAGVWKKRAYSARQKYQRWYRAQFLLRDFAFRPGNNAWLRAIAEVQRPFPGTASWLYSCSGAEGGHGRWVGYGGQGYSSWLRDSDTVGGPMQFRWSTFKGMYRNALEHVRARGFTVPSHLRDPSNDITWRSALGQAMAAGWARYTGNDNSHWSASWGNGC